MTISNGCCWRGGGMAISLGDECYRVGPYMHHGKMREAILAHSGEALSARRSFEALPAYDRDASSSF